MRQLRHQRLFSPKLPGLVMRKKKRPTIPTACRIDAKPFLSNPQDKAKLEQALSSPMEKVYDFIVGSKKRQRRVYRWCLGISTVLNIVAWIAFFMWVALPKQVAPIIDDKIVYVTSLDIPPIPRQPDTPEPPPKPMEEEEQTPRVEESPEDTPDTSEELPPVPPEVPAEEPSNKPQVEPKPPPEETPVVSEEEADAPVVDPLDFEPLLDTAEDTRTQYKKSESIALNTLHQPLQDEENPRVVETDLANLSPLQPKQASAPHGGKPGSIAPELPVSNLHQQGKGEDQKQHGIKTVLDLPALQAEDENSEAKKQRTTGSALGLPDFQAGRKSETSQQEVVKPAVEFQPLHRKGEGTKPFKIVPKPSKKDLKLQRLPELITPITPKFPPVQGVQTCTVVIWLWVETNGAPGKISVHKVTPSLDETKGRAFRQAAIEAVKGARFTPACLDGQPVRLLIQIPIWFDRSRQQNHP